MAKEVGGGRSQKLSILSGLCKPHKAKKKDSASSGNRTRAARVAGEHSTTEPTMLICGIQAKCENTPSTFSKL